jgi:hypothetical protein
MTQGAKADVAQARGAAAGGAAAVKEELAKCVAMHEGLLTYERADGQRVSVPLGSVLCALAEQGDLVRFLAACTEARRPHFEQVRPEPKDRWPEGCRLGHAAARGAGRPGCPPRPPQVSGSVIELASSYFGKWVWAGV